MRSKWLPIVLVLLGILIGAGGVWGWQRRQWKTVAHSRALHEQIAAHIMTIADLYGKHVALLHAEREFYADQAGSANIAAEIDRLWTHEFPIIHGHIAECELRLSQLENRPPKAYHFRLPPPTTPEVAPKKKTPQASRSGRPRPPEGPQGHKLMPRSLDADVPTRRDVSRDDDLDRTHLPTE